MRALIAVTLAIAAGGCELLFPPADVSVEVCPPSPLVMSRYSVATADLDLGYDGADVICYAMDQHLVVFDDPEELALVAQAFPAPQGFWTGLYFDGGANPLADTECTPTFLPWSATEPDHTDDCVAVVDGDLDGLVDSLADEDCATTYPVIVCESFQK